MVKRRNSDIGMNPHNFDHFHNSINLKQPKSSSKGNYFMRYL